jgi:L-threonylcarbamoyladenylate synthase
MTYTSLDAQLDRAVNILREGGLVAIPTDTVYGLAALPSSDDAVRRLFKAKRRHPGQATPILISAPQDLAALVSEVPKTARALMAAFWPGQLTVVLPKAQRFRSLASPGTTVGVRVPDNEVPRRLVELLGSPITGTSANIAGGAEPLTSDDVSRQLGSSVDMVIDGGRCPGTPSTVVDCTVDPPRIVRLGAISREELIRAAGARFAE